MKVIISILICFLSGNAFAKNPTFADLFEERLKPQLENQIREHFAELLTVRKSHEFVSNKYPDKVNSSNTANITNVTNYTSATSNTYTANNSNPANSVNQTNIVNPTNAVSTTNTVSTIDTTNTAEVSWNRLKLPDQVANLDASLAKKIVLSPLKFEGKGVVVIRFEVSGQAYSFTAEYRILSDVYVTQRAISATEKLSENDLHLKKMDVTYLNDRPAQLEEFLGRTLNRSLQVGQILHFNDLKREPLVDRGQSVKIRIVSEGMEISATGISEQVGFLNDWIKITNPETKKVIVGQVVERGLVEIR